LGGYSHDLGCETIGPLLRDKVDLTIKFTHRDGLRVENLLVDNLETSIGMVSISQSGHDVSKHLIASSLTATSRSDKHNTETHIESLVKENNFLHEGGLRLEAELSG
jgi:hypothetical protein